MTTKKTVPQRYVPNHLSKKDKMIQKKGIIKSQKLYKKGKYTHKRIFQVSMILYVRLRALKDKKRTHYKIAKEYFEFLKKRTKSKKRKSMKFDISLGCF